jgi:ABC-2 type transport system permease protein
MRKTLLVSLYELWTTMRRKSFLFLAFGIPVLVVLIFGAIELLRSEEPGGEEAAPGDDSSGLVSEGYVDEAGVIESLPEGPARQYLRPYGDEEQAAVALEAGEIEGYYIIPPGYPDGADIVRVYPDDAALSPAGQVWLLRWTLLVNLLDGDETLAARAWNPVDLEITDVSPQPDQDQYPGDDCTEPGGACESSPLVRFIPGAMVVLFYAFFMVSSALLFNSVAAEKENRTVEIMLVSISPQQMLAGKLVGLGIASVLQVAAWLGGMYAVLTIGGQTLDLPDGFSLPAGVLPWSIVFFILGYVIYAGLMAGAGALVPSRKEGTQATFVVLMPLIAAYLIGFLSPIAGASQAPLPVVLSFFPLTAPVLMVMRLTEGVVPLWQLLLSAGLMAVTAYGIVRTSGAMFRAQRLLSGQPFSVRRYFAALLGRA